MNPFVNYQKREIDLPKGCKDLVEMLQIAKPDSDSKSKWKLVSGLIESERFVRTQLLSPATLRHLSIALPGQEDRVQLTHFAGVLSIVLSLTCGETGRLQAVRAVFHAAGVIPIADQVMSHAPTPWRLIICPLPTSGPDGAELIVQLLRSGLALPEDTQLYFSFDEKDTT
jgi:hypothetical protein